MITAFALLLNVFTPLQLFIGGGQAVANLIAVTIIVLYDELFTKKSFWILMSYVAVCLAMHFSGVEYFEGVIPQLLLVMLGYVIWEHYLKSQDVRYGMIVLMSTYGALLSLILLSIPQFYLNPNMTRMMNAAKADGHDLSIFYWIINYQTVHALPVYAIPLFIVFKGAQKKWQKLFFGFFIISIFVVMLFADATTPLILLMLIFACLIIYKYDASVKENLRRFLVVGAFALIFLNKVIIVSFLQAVQPVFEGSSTYRKIDEICMAITSQDTSGDMEIREDVLSITLGSIANDPLFPETNISKVGQHNFLLDMFAVQGLFLFVPLALFIWNRYKAGITYISIKMKPYFFMAFFSMLLMATTKNYFLAVPTFGIVPLFLNIIDYRLNNNEL